jgi:hypothetical protein
MKRKLKATVLSTAISLALLTAAGTDLYAQSSGRSKPLHYGHGQHSGLNTGSFGVIRTDYDDYTSPFYCTAAFTENLKDRNFTAPVLKAGVDENYWNAGASMQYGSVYGSLVYYNAIANFQDWPANMTDLGLAGTFAFGKTFSAQARYYDFCISGGEGMAMPGLTLAAQFGKGDYKARIALGGDLCLWHLAPWETDKIFPRIQANFDFSRDSMRGFGLSYRLVIPLDGPESRVDLDDVAASHTISFWGGVAKDFGRYTVGIRPSGHINLNAVNPSDIRYWELTDDDGAIGKADLFKYDSSRYRLGEYNPYAKAGNMDFLVRLPVALACRVSQYVTVTGGALFGLYYANFDHYGFTGLGGDNGKGWVPEVGISLGLGFEMGGASLQVGSSFIRAPSIDRSKYNERDSEKQFWRHSYYAEDLSLANIASAPLTISLRFSF